MNLPWKSITNVQLDLLLCLEFTITTPQDNKKFHGSKNHNKNFNGGKSKNKGKKKKGKKNVQAQGKGISNTQNDNNCRRCGCYKHSTRNDVRLAIWLIYTKTSLAKAKLKHQDLKLATIKLMYKMKPLDPNKFRWNRVAMCLHWWSKTTWTQEHNHRIHFVRFVWRPMLGCLIST